MTFDAITSAVEAAGTMTVGLIGDAIDLIMAQPLLLLPVAISFVGIGYGFAKSFLRV